MERKSFHIKGMCCAEEVGLLKKRVGPLVGGDLNLQFDLLNHRMTVLAPPGEEIDGKKIAKAVSQTGMEAIPWEEPHLSFPSSSEQPFWRRHGRTLLCALSGALLLAGFFLETLHRGGVMEALRSDTGTDPSLPFTVIAVYGAAILSGAWYVIPRAIAAARNLRPDMNLLMIVAVTGAMGLGEWLEASSVSFLFALALLLESWSVERARKAIKALIDISPKNASILDPQRGTLEEKPVEEVPAQAIVLVRPGEKIPLDGVITKGSSFVDQSPITGESLPVARFVGDEVYAGTINGDGSIEFRVTRPASDTTLAQIIHLVEEAQARRAPAEQWVERFARIYTPSMMLLALTIALMPPLLMAQDWSLWFYRALVLLVIACPCSLVISTPVSIVAGLTSAARNGILIKGGAFLEAPAKLKTMAFDKTGTLTKGQPSLQKIIPLENHSREELLAKAASLEMHSTHPLARAVVRRAREEGIEIPEAHDFTILPGQGAQGIVHDAMYWIGNLRLLKERHPLSADLEELAGSIEDAGHSMVIMWRDDHVCGLMSFADEVRPESRNTIGELKSLGVERVVMITGDHEKTAREVAAATGVSQWHFELLPQDKVKVIEELKQDGDAVAMVGDGVNDAPAMAGASVSIAMGAMGSDVAIETADIALMSDDLSKLPWLIRHSRRTLNIIKTNIAFSLGLKLIFVGMASVGTATLWMAIAADMGASLLVIANGLRLLRIGSGGASL